MGYEWKATIDQLKCWGTITLRLDERQQAAFNDSFVRLFLRARQSNGQEMNSSVVRLAINLVRFMEVVAMLRPWNNRNYCCRPKASTATT